MSKNDLSLHDSQPEIPKACIGKVDRISDLPDDILLRIISSLTLKEAGSTSVLSKRWRHLWAYLPNLNFDASELLDKMEIPVSRKKLNAEEAKYFCWVDQVVKSHRAHTIDEFRVRFNFPNKRYDNFDHWLSFAMEKRVKRLEFNTLALWVDSHLLSYTLPSLSPWSPLTSLELAYVSVTGKVLQKFLSDCPNLELLSVTYSTSLVDLKVHSLRLKSLKLAQCFQIEHMEISAPSLISFYYHGPVISWPMKDAPNLTELYVGGSYGKNLMGDFSTLSSFMSQVEVFSLGDMGVFHLFQESEVPKVFPVATRLKMLHIGFLPQNAEELFDLIYLIKSCPMLHKLELELPMESDLKMTEETRGAEVFPHDKLKILEIHEYAGFEADMGFAMYLIKTFVSVEKITIKANGGHVGPIRLSRLRAKAEAEKLFALIKPGTELEIICPETD